MALSTWIVHDEKLPLNLATAVKALVSCGFTSDMFPYPVESICQLLSSTSIFKKTTLNGVSPLVKCPVSKTLSIPAVHVKLLKLCRGKTVVSCESAWAG